MAKLSNPYWRVVAQALVFVSQQRLRHVHGNLLRAIPSTSFTDQHGYAFCPELEKRKLQ